MKFKPKARFFLIICGISLSGVLSAQTILTEQIANPSFETGDYTGWTWTGRTGGWLDVNSDGDATMDGSKIAGYWNNDIGDVECSQTITGLANGIYRVTALATVSTNRTSTQRLFANSISKLFGATGNPAYSPENLAILGATETYSFGGYAESGAENGPFKKLSVVTEVTDGNLSFGFRLNGKGTALGYNFSYSPLTDVGFFKFDNFTLAEVSNEAALDNITLSAGILDEVFSPLTTAYTATLPKGTKTVVPTVVISADGQTVTGVDTVDVTSGSGTSVIVVKSIDNSTTKTYTISYTVSSTQTDLTSRIVNPSFEIGDYTGWTWTGRTGGWIDVNSDGDGTKDGSKIAGYWNNDIGDVECSQAITALENGIYRVTALATVSTDRTTTQRLFANSKSKLYGASDNAAYSTENLAILGATETYSFGGYEESTAENGPFKKLSVVTPVTDGNLSFGFRLNGKGSALGYDFSYSPQTDVGFFKFDNFTLTEVSSEAALDNITLSAGSLDDLFSTDTTTYSATLPFGTLTVTPTAVVSVDGQTVTGVDAIDVSSGSGTSTIVVKSIDGTAIKTYTINYTVLQTSAFAVLSYVSDSVSVNFTLGRGILKLRVCNDKIIQVSYSMNSTLPEKDSIIVNKVWEIPNFEVTEDADNVSISTNSLTVKVLKANSLLSFYDKSGQLILSEDNKQITLVSVSGITTNTCSATFNSPVSEGIFGLGQHQQKIMDYKANKVVLDQQNTEIALPFMVTTSGYGLLWDNYSLTNFNGDVAANTKYQFSSESGKMVDYYFMYGPEIDDVISGYRTASGEAPLFPKWAYGLFQSKDKYTSATEVLNIANQYRDARFPLDCIVQDWDYWTPDYWGSHTMDATRYPDPKALVDSLHAMNLHTMISIWPVFHKNTSNYEQFNAINAVYPSAGTHHFYDPHNDAAKKIYWDQVNNQLFSKYGWDAWWADNDEPQGYPDGFDRKSFITAKGSGVTYYNTYPIEHTEAVYNGWRNDIPNKRIFTLSRSAFSGQQRYATAAWSGDITSTWEAYQKQLSAGLNFCLSGMPYWTTDIGGYIYTDWSTVENNELMIRWFQYGAFCPIFRIHGQGDKALVSNTFTTSTVDNLVATDKLRYRLMPYIYSMAWKVTNEGYTMMRHLVMDYRTDENVKTIDNQFMFGQSMMINPITSAGVTKRTVYLPEGNWYDFWTGEQYNGSQTINTDAPIDKIPVFVKAGSIVPMGPEIMYADESIDPIEIRVYKGANGNFTLYEDEGDNYDYEKGSYSVIPFSYNETSKELTIGDRIGNYKNMLENRNFKIVWVDVNYGTGVNIPITCDTIVQYNGNQAVIPFDTNDETDIQNFKDGQTRFNVYPNPATDKITISFYAEIANKTEISLINSDGKCVYLKKFEALAGTNVYTMNAKQNNIKSGVYLMKITCGKDQYISKFILE
jgi:alpha-D-xyloside xylohydrolase